MPLVMDIGVREAHITDDDDDFVDPSRRCEVTSHQETPRADEGPSGPQHSPNEEQHHGMQGSAVLHDLNVQMSELKSQNKVLTVEMDTIKSQMSSLNSDQAKKITEIIIMQGQLKCDMTEIRTNVQFLSESVIAMISSSMDEILRQFNDRKCCLLNEYEETEAAVVGGEKSHVVGGFEKIDEMEKQQPIVDRKGKGKVDPTDDVAFPCSLQPLSFDLGIEYSQSDDLKSVEIQKQIDAVISDVITASKNVDEEGSPTPEPAFELPVKWISRPARILQSPFVASERKVLQHDGVGNFEKDPDYNKSECKQMKVTIDSTLPQQTNSHDCGVFMILYALYILRDGRCSIPHQFDTAKCRLDITSLLYKHREPNMKKFR
ncbi:sentrin-specific protease 1-like [Olea europaea subsp. europaea]|uniref:Sentrin-specific protease 1-like n=1 Tax=Olea europaea subsp. europaea TaxID=158383 RepID=A0A8S0R4K9_OLEEU|nr:sentrin-specific protease 1-like [Olea europaea subsp. europaea]